MFGKIAAGLGLIAVGAKVEAHADFAKLAAPYRDVIDKASAAYGYNANLLAAQLYEESSFNPAAKGAAGEIGMAQIMPATFNADIRNHFPEFRAYDAPDLYKPEIAIPACAAWMSFLARNDNVFKALRDYNAGETGATRNPDAGAGYEADIVANALIDWLWINFGLSGKT
jgi:soluble lytic murein transglycosylase-like protein